MIGNLLIANRGEVVARIARTARRMGIRTIGVYSDADRDNPTMASVDVALRLPGVTAAETYLDGPAIVRAAETSGADAVHPGYGFLAESPEFAAAVEASGLVWVGPTPVQMSSMGDKVAARAAAVAAGVPVLPAGPVSAAGAVGFPLIVKAAAGGGGKGMRAVHEESDLDAAVASAAGEAERSFGDATVYVERLVSPARHIEVQVFGDGLGGVVHLFERECSIQRRHQKIIEEAPAPGIDDSLRRALCAAAVRLAAHIDYRGAGTVEFVVGDDGFWFIEMNTRLQVEHPVTEAVTGLDLVEWQLLVAAGEPMPVTQDDVTVAGHAIEARIYAEDPAAGWIPGVGEVLGYRHGPGNARYEDAIATGSVITPLYDAMVAKVITHRPAREAAASALAAELAAMSIHCPATNRDFLVAALRSDSFRSGATYTSFVDDHPELSAVAADPQVRDAHLAAAVWARIRRNRAADPHWGFAAPGWRNVPSQPQQVWFDGAVISYQVDGEALTFTAGDRTTTASVSGGEPFLVEIDGVGRHCAVAVHGNTLWVNGSDGQSVFREDPRFTVHDSVLSAGGPTAPVPGTVVAVLVEAGDEVGDGADLLVMEAMKMEHRIKAPGPSRVVEVLVAPGDQVDAGRLLIRLEERAP